MTMRPRTEAAVIAAKETRNTSLHHDRVLD